MSDFNPCIGILNGIGGEWNTEENRREGSDWSQTNNREASDLRFYCDNGILTLVAGCPESNDIKLR